MEHECYPKSHHDNVHALADNSRFPNDDARASIDKQTIFDSRRGMDIDSGERMRELGNKAGRLTGLPVGETRELHDDESWPSHPGAYKHLIDRMRRRIAIVSRCQIAFDQAPDRGDLPSELSHDFDRSGSVRKIGISLLRFSSRATCSTIRSSAWSSV